MTKTYISLKEAVKYCPYSQDYLKLRARQGKLRAEKMGRNWFTTKEWLQEYKNNLKTSKKPVKTEKKGLKKKLPFKRFLFLFLIVFLIIGGTFLLIKFSEPILERIIPAKVYWIQ